MSQTENEDRQVIVPVRVVEPLPSRGRREILQTRFGRLSTTRAALAQPALVLPERPNRVEAFVMNSQTTGPGIQIGHSPNVQTFVGAEIPPGIISPKITGANPVYVTADQTIGAGADAILVSTVDTYLVPYDRVKKQMEDTKKR